jgi:hypothetical protein
MVRSALAFLLVGLSLVSCGSCGEELVSSAASADGRYEARIVEVNCGATTDFSWRVELKDAGQRRIERVATFDGADSASVAWRGRTLVVAHKGERFRAASEVFGLPVEYTPLISEAEGSRAGGAPPPT